MSSSLQNVVLLAGGVGGGRMAEGLARALPEGGLTVVANISDDETFYGLQVCPDLDTILYTLSDRIDRSQGWGVANDTVKALEVLGGLGAPVWMKLGDSDFGLHIWRSWRLSQGALLSDVARECAMRFKVPANVLPASNDPVRTKLLTDDGLLDFQAWFVGQRCKPRVRGVRYVGAESAAAAPGVIEAIHRADAILFAPSNPLLSIEPIMAITPIRDAIRHSSAARIGVSPLINGKAVKGPLAQMLDDIRLPGGASGVAARYKGLLDAFVVDESDCDDRKKIEESGLKTLSADILMRNPSDATRLAREVLNYAVGFAKAPGGGST